MTTIVAETDALRMPRWLADLDSFHTWVESDDVPEKFKPWFFCALAVDEVHVAAVRFITRLDDESRMGEVWFALQARPEGLRRNPQARRLGAFGCIRRVLPARLRGR